MPRGVQGATRKVRGSPILNELTVGEYNYHLHEAFEKEYFNGKDGFVFSKSALIDGLENLEHESINIECFLEDTHMGRIERADISFALRRCQVIANILIKCLDGVHLKMNEG
ncbi:hypothetical protein LCGC14_1290550 [marine sediment metagenome]|uniref:Uncharacterized protein n=1 Tax=marine sediment metagenome TaxID=412755 RepID=A0A0F9KSQ2_9ZZZZ